MKSYYFYPPGHPFIADFFWKEFDRIFEYAGHKTGTRVFEYKGRVEDLGVILSKIGLKIKQMGHCSKTEWNEGDWQMVYLTFLE